MDALLIIIAWTVVRVVIPVVLLISVGEWVKSAGMRIYR